MQNLKQHRFTTVQIESRIVERKRWPRWWCVRHVASPLRNRRWIPPTCVSRKAQPKSSPSKRHVRGTSKLNSCLHRGYHLRHRRHGDGIMRRAELTHLYSNRYRRQDYDCPKCDLTPTFACSRQTCSKCCSTSTRLDSSYANFRKYHRDLLLRDFSTYNRRGLPYKSWSVLPSRPGED